MIGLIRKHLSWKLFLSYVIVILVGVLVLGIVASYSAPTSFDRHMSAMSAMMSRRMGNPGRMEADLYSAFRTTMTEAMTYGTLAAVFSAALVSFLLSRQVTKPVEEMMDVTEKIADGNYRNRVQVRGDLEKDELDELSRLGIRFNRMADKLQRTEEMRRQLLGDVAHELRTPLTAIKGTVEGLMDGVIPEDTLTYRQIYQEVDRLQRLVADLEELSRVEAGAYELNCQALDLCNQFEAVAKRMGVQFADKQIDLDFDCPASLPKIYADQDRLQQILVNLLGNALQYTPEGGQVKLYANRTGHDIQVSVSDTGIGIPVEELSQIFVRFYRVDKSRSRAGGGSGIGLTVIKHLVEAHGGQIWAESAGRGQGSTFHFTLPQYTTT